MYELAVRGRVPPNPVTRVATEAVAVEQRGVIADGGGSGGVVVAVLVGAPT